MEKLIHLVFKTHLDIGFTDHAAKVRAQYHDRFIPQAIETGEHFFAEDPAAPQFIWTTGAWLIWDHLNTQPPERVRRLERAIERGLIRWHALPFTTHSELMSPALFRAGLSYSAELDKRFGKTTIAAKMTDVPGHTLGIVPLLAEAGVRFLHLGVNTASPPPDVPDIFRWRAPDDSEVVVMYQNVLRRDAFPVRLRDGPQLRAHLRQYRAAERSADSRRLSEPPAPPALRHYPRLDARRLRRAALGRAKASSPSSISNSAIAGSTASASDPEKMSRFLALQRLYDDFAGEALTPRRLVLWQGSRHGRRTYLGRRHQILPA